MRIGLTLNYSGGFKEAVEHVVELEKIGADIALVAEAYSYDAVSQLGYLAAKTSTIELGSGVFPIYTRTPSLLAMTAAGLDFVSDGRFQLGIGTSGPQVVEGFHGLPFDAPLGRTREVVDICRQVWRRERVNYDGKHYQVPLPADRGTGLGSVAPANGAACSWWELTRSPRWSTGTIGGRPCCSATAPARSYSRGKKVRAECSAAC